MSAETDRARRLRRDQTGAEHLLWSRLRNRQPGGWKFRRQMPLFGFIADFYCADKKLVIELDGGGHTHDRQTRRDRQRTELLENTGVLVVRFWNEEVLNNLDGVVDTILDLLDPGTAFAPPTIVEPSDRKE